MEKNKLKWTIFLCDENVCVLNTVQSGQPDKLPCLSPRLRNLGSLTIEFHTMLKKMKASYQWKSVSRRQLAVTSIPFLEFDCKGSPILTTDLINYIHNIQHNVISIWQHSSPHTPLKLRATPFGQRAFRRQNKICGLL